MPLIAKHKSNLFAFQFARQSTLRQTDELINQLQEQLRKEREQHRFDLAQKECENLMLVRENVELRYELAKRDREAAFVNPLSPSAMRH
jgi:hypothetical protein